LWGGKKKELRPCQSIQERENQGVPKTLGGLVEESF
jgi:hypothetical protein